MEKIEQYIDRGVDKALKEIETLVVEYAKKHHRYQNRTGHLTASIGAVLNTYTNKLNVFSRAPYSKFIHDGTKYIEPDPWIEEAIIHNYDKIIEILEYNIDQSLRRS